MTENLPFSDTRVMVPPYRLTTSRMDLVPQPWDAPSRLLVRGMPPFEDNLAAGVLQVDHGHGPAAAHIHHDGAVAGGVEPRHGLEGVVQGVAEEAVDVALLHGCEGGPVDDAGQRRPAFEGRKVLLGEDGVQGAVSGAVEGVPGRRVPPHRLGEAPPHTAVADLLLFIGRFFTNLARNRRVERALDDAGRAGAESGGGAPSGAPTTA